MSDIIPSFFSKSDFWAMLLPGYVTVTLGLLLFFPNFLPGHVSSKDGQNIPFEVFSVVVFIVAGPSVGFVLWQIYFHISSLAFFFTRDVYNRKYEFQRVYERLRIVCDDSEKSELDSLDSRHIFGMSTAVGLFIIGLYAILVVFGLSYFNHQSVYCMNSLVQKHAPICRDTFRTVVISIGSISIGLILFFRADLHNKRVRLPLMCNFMEKYILESTLTCRLRRNAFDFHRKKKGYDLIKKFVRKKIPKQSYLNRFKSMITRPYEKLRKKSIHIPSEIHVTLEDLENFLVYKKVFDQPTAMDTIEMLVKDGIIEIKDEKEVKELHPEKEVKELHPKELKKKKWEKA